MGVSKRVEGIEPWLVLGASLYWAAIVIQFLLPAASAERAGLFANSCVRYLILAGYVAVGFLVPRLLTSEVGRRWLVGVSLVAALAAYPLATAALGPICDSVRILLHLFSIAVLMVLWGFAFASMDKRQAGKNVTITMLASTLLILVVLASTTAVPTEASTRLLMAASCLVLLSGRVRFRDHRRQLEPQAGARRPMASFLLSRVAFGVVMGFGIGAPLHLCASDASPALMGLAFAIVAVVSIGCLRSVDRLYFALPTLLVLTMGVTYLPFFEKGLESAAECVVGLVWLAWAEFSAFQLSDLKERLGMGECGLCLIEKFVLSVAMAAGVGMFGLVDAVVPSLAYDALEVGLFGTACFLILGATYVVGCLVGERTEDRMRAELAQTRREQIEDVYDRLASEYGLSLREREVMGMLAEGYTRAYIRDALGVSDGTAKAHIAHIYQKLDVHRKDDLLEFIDAEIGKAETRG